MIINLKFRFNTNANFENLANMREVLVGMLLDVMSKTLLRAVRDRFALARDGMAKIEENPTTVPADIKPYKLAQLNKTRAALQEAEQERASEFSSVLALLVNQQYIQLEDTGNSITLGAGYIPSLDEIRSPSATPKLHGRESSSPYNILWRQMEFGMGVMMRKPYPYPVAQTRSSSDRGWWYGPKTPRAGVHFKGTPPGNLLRDRTNLPYTEDALRFSELFTLEMNRLFFR